MLLVEGNTKLLDPETKHCDDLCQMILNNLTLVRRPVVSQGTTGGMNGGISVHSDDDEFGGDQRFGGMDKDEEDLEDGNEDNEGGELDGEGGKQNLNDSIGKKIKQPNTEIMPPPRLGESSLAVEHKIFLNPDYKRDYDYRNDKLIKKN